ncbi:MAG TPA: HPF/RaiA family ribosome-associated protein [Ignavibacteria bacterium]|nr:HPF/RaiA family ribosome-associated protein [Ignavibacteria bacterium]
MKIQINTDNKIKGSIKLQDNLIPEITEELSRYSEQITRVEIHLSDEKGSKGGVKDKKCVIEVRLAGRQPVAVTNKADTVELAVSGAMKKLKNSLNKIFGKLKNY